MIAIFRGLNKNSWPRFNHFELGHDCMGKMQAGFSWARRKDVGVTLAEL